MKGLLADANMRGPVEYLAQRMQAKSWGEFWTHLGLQLLHFEEVGLTPTSSDLEIWHCCQSRKLILITNNRNAKSPDSLELTIRQHSTSDSLPVFTVANLDKLRNSGEYVERVIQRVYECLLVIETLRGTGRLYVP